METTICKHCTRESMPDTYQSQIWGAHRHAQVVHCVQDMFKYSTDGVDSGQMKCPEILNLVHRPKYQNKPVKK